MNIHYQEKYMGNWGNGIMQSDDALDAEIEIFEAVNLSWNERSKKKIGRSFIIGFDNIAKVCDKYKEIDSYNTAVYWQVLAYHGMKNGVPFNEQQQQTIIDGITICEEYQQGKKYPNSEDLQQAVKEKYIKDFGEEGWNQNVEIWGEDSLRERVAGRTKNITQLLEDFNQYVNNSFSPFERKENGLIDTMIIKSKKIV